jgi:SAM-dependent methyltransferase
MAKTTLVIDDETREVLRQCTIQDFNLYLPATLDPALYKRVDAVLRLAGACWDRKQPAGPSGRKGAHVVTPNTADKLGLAIEHGKIIDVKKLNQQFFTPVAVAEEIVDSTLDELQETLAFQPETKLRIMEPSAGNGRFLDALCQWLTGGLSPYELNLSTYQVVAVELDADLVQSLRSRGYNVLQGDFMQLKPKATSLCDYIFMNPPFAAGQDMRHIMHAFNFLKPGGKLIAITSRGAGLGQNKLHQEFKDFCNAFRYHSYDLEPGTFAESGTQVATTVHFFKFLDF